MHFEDKNKKIALKDRRTFKEFGLSMTVVLEASEELVTRVRTSQQQPKALPVTMRQTKTTTLS